MTTSTEIDIANEALSNLGISELLAAGDGTIASESSGRPEAVALKFWLPRERDKQLSEWPWGFAKKIADLTVADDGTGEDWSSQWGNAYVWPADMLVPRNFIRYTTGDGTWDYYFQHRYVAIQNWAFEQGFHDSKRVIFSDVADADAIMEYTLSLTASDVDQMPDDFIDALGYRVAWRIAPSVSADPEVIKRVFLQYKMSVRQAKVTAFNAQNKRPEQDGDFVLARGGG